MIFSELSLHKQEFAIAVNTAWQTATFRERERQGCVILKASLRRGLLVMCNIRTSGYENINQRPGVYANYEWLRRVTDDLSLWSKKKIYNYIYIALLLRRKNQNELDNFLCSTYLLYCDLFNINSISIIILSEEKSLL